MMINKGKELVNEGNKNIKARTNIKISMINKKYFFGNLFGKKKYFLVFFRFPTKAFFKCFVN